MRRAVTQDAQPFAVPGGRVAVQGQRAVRQPGAVPRQRLAVQVGKAHRGEQFGAGTAGLEVDQRRGAHVEGEPAPAEVAGAAAGVAVCLEDHSGQSGGLQPQRGRHAGQAGAEHRHVAVSGQRPMCLNGCSEHAFKIVARVGAGQ